MGIVSLEAPFNHAMALFVGCLGTTTVPSFVVVVLWLFFDGVLLRNECLWCEDDVDDADAVVAAAVAVAVADDYTKCQ